VKADDDVAVTATLTDEEIVGLQLQKSQQTTAMAAQDGEENDNHDNQVDDSRQNISVSTTETVNALDTVHNWLECNGSMNTNGLMLVAELEQLINNSRSTHQATITDYFSQRN